MIKIKDPIYKHRIDSLKEILGSLGLDAILVFSSMQEFCYATFLDGTKPIFYQYFLMTAERETLLVPNFLLSPIDFVQDGRAMPFDEERIDRELAMILNKFKKIGVVGPAPAIHLKKYGGEIVFIDAEVEKLLAEKTDHEIKQIESNKQMIEKTFELAKKIISPGVKLTAIADKLEKELLKTADSLYFPVIVYSVNSRKSAFNFLNIFSRVKDRDWILIDMAVEKNGLMADCTEMFFINMPEEEKIYRRFKQAHYNVLKQLKPGLEIQKITGLYVQEFDKMGVDYQFINQDFLAQSTGFKLMERPYIGTAQTDTGVLKKNMVISIIPKIRLRDGRIFEVQDTVII